MEEQTKLMILKIILPTDIKQRRRIVKVVLKGKGVSFSDLGRIFGDSVKFEFEKNMSWPK